MKKNMKVHIALQKEVNIDLMGKIAQLESSKEAKSDANDSKSSTKRKELIKEVLINGSIHR